MQEKVLLLSAETEGPHCGGAHVGCFKVSSEVSEVCEVCEECGVREVCEAKYAKYAGYAES